MPGLVLEGVNPSGNSDRLQSPTVDNDNNNNNNNITTASHSDGGLNPNVQPSIDQLYDNVCDMESSADGDSRRSFESDGSSRIDSELRHLVGGEVRRSSERPVEEGEEIVVSSVKDVAIENASSDDKKSETKGPGASRQPKSSRLNSSDRSGGKAVGNGITAARTKKEKNPVMVESKTQNETDDVCEGGLDNPNLGPYLLKHARDLIQGDNHRRALDYAVRASKSFDKCANGKPCLELVMSLHVLAAIHCSIGQHALAVPLLERSIEIPSLDEGQGHFLAKFAGYMQLGDTYGMMGQLENSILSYSKGLEVQKQALGENDLRVGETCRHLAEVYMQALQFDEAERLCKIALDIHKESGEPASLEETADRRLMALICEAKGDHEAALEHLVLASMSMVSNGQETEVGSVDCSIGDAYLSLNRYDEAVFAYQKALNRFKSSKGENHPSVASVFVRLADLYNKTGKIRESKFYCENALRIYTKPPPGAALEDIASGYTDLSVVYASMHEQEQALKLLHKALKIYDDAPGQQSTVAGIEAQMGVLYYIIGKYSDSYLSLKIAIAKLRASGEKRSAFFGVALNQLGLACVQRYEINEAADCFEEARVILEQECGLYHPDTLGVLSNLAGTYDALGRSGDAIEILEKIVAIREDKLGTANPDVGEERRRLTELLRGAGKVRSKAPRSLENLLDTNHHTANSSIAA